MTRGKLALTLGACILATGLSATAALAADIGVTVDELTLNGVESVSVSLPGVVVGGGPGNWTLDFGPTGINVSLNFQGGGVGYLVWEGTMSTPGFNVLSNLGNNLLGFQSGVTLPVGANSNNFCGLGAPLPQGVTCFMGDTAQDRYFITVVETVQTTVAEPASLALLGAGLLGLTALRRRRNA